MTGLMNEGENEMGKWTVLEDTTYEEDTAWNKEYASDYDEYICYIKIPKVENQIAMTNSMIFGSAVIYYKAVGNASYATEICVHIEKVQDSFVLEESGCGAITGIGAFVAAGLKKQDERFRSYRVAINTLPKDTHISVYARRLTA